jgi:hypothetical protein
MSPISIAHVFRQIPTTLELNGPILSFTSIGLNEGLQPTTTAVCDGGTAQFTGFATAIFPTQDPANNVLNNGTISYQWHEVGVGALSDSANITGTATTVLTLSNLASPTDNGRQFFLRADYIPSAYGIGRSTGNALNDPLDSSTVGITVYPSITITKQPTDQTAAQTFRASFEVNASITDATQGPLGYRWSLNGTDLSDSATVSGSGTTTLSIALPNVGVNTVRARVTHPTSCDSPVLSNVANFEVVSARQIINFESVSGSSGNATLQSVNLFDSSFTVSPFDVGNFPLTSFYAAEQDLNVRVELYGPPGPGNGSFSGGQGGISIINLFMPKDVEFVIAQIPTSSLTRGGIYLYRQSRLVACMGQGGQAGSSGNGGNAGGLGIAGASGAGRGGGQGGSLIAAGTLPPEGFNSSGTTPGRTMGCPGKNAYWYNLGFSLCQNMGNVQFFRANGAVAGNTAVISRGFKAGFGLRGVGGTGSGGGDGGGGATGGYGGTSGGGGGGGSGYTDGSYTIISSTQGGNTGEGRVVFKLLT